jgi:hypothetical protein
MCEKCDSGGRTRDSRRKEKKQHKKTPGCFLGNQGSREIDKLNASLVCHCLPLITSLPFVHTARRSYQLSDPVNNLNCSIVLVLTLQ